MSMAKSKRDADCWPIAALLVDGKLLEEMVRATLFFEHGTKQEAISAQQAYTQYRREALARMR